MSKTAPAINSWEARALEYEFPAHGSTSPDGTAATTWRKVQDPVIYPGLYSGSGFDMMSVLLRVVSRPNPQIDLGPVDCSVAIIICDLLQPDQPIVYASDSFCELTGYSTHEILGKNCRFLQIPPGSNNYDAVKPADKVAIHKIRQAVGASNEIQTQITNYKKNGQAFKNVLSIVPVQWDSAEYRYAVGFQVEMD